MRPQYDKIRVLWIEDQPGLGAQNCDLGEFAEYFRIVGAGVDNVTSVRAIEEYDSLLVYHLSLRQQPDDSEIDPFPVEIISADYDLSKYTPGTDTVGDRNRPVGMDYESLLSSGAQDSPTIQSHAQKTEQQLRDVNYNDYDGCIINTMYLSEFFAHPCGSVVTTYQEPTARHKCAKKLETHLCRCCQIDLTFSGTRSWKSVLTAGVRALRGRIEKLHIEGKIILSPSDLETLIEDPRNGVLTVRSPHATRRLPIQGLFIDVKDDRDIVIKEWVRGLIDHIIDYDVYVQGNDLAKKVWEAYCNNSWVDERRHLSQKLCKYTDKELIALIESLKSDQCSEAEIIDLWSKYQFEANAEGRGLRTTCSKKTCDVLSWGDEYSKSARRWAILLLIFKLFEQILKKRVEIAAQYRELLDREYDESLPHITQDDVCLTLFPVPKTPLILPWDKGSNITAESTWSVNLKRMKDEKSGKPLALSLEHVLNGDDWHDEGPYGIKPGERYLLQGLCLDSKIGMDQWQQFGVAARFIWGKKGE